MRRPLSLFGRVNRFVPSAQTTPRENRLTEAFAGVLERVDGLAYALAMDWLDPLASRDPRERCGAPAPAVRERLASSEWPEVEVATQVPTKNRSVDLELRFRSQDRPSIDDVRLWVEIKHGTAPRGGQVPAYVADLADMGAVVLLAPGASLPYDIGVEMPDVVPQRAWEQVGQLCARFEASKASKSIPAVEEWLLDEFVTYLREESLMELESVGPEHLTALTYYRQAEDALAVICGQAKAYVERNWDGARDGEEGKAGIPYGVWYSWPSDPHGPHDSFLDWSVTRASTVHPIPPDGAVFFMAGLNVAKGREFAVTDEQRAWQRALEEGTDIDGRRVYFQRWRGNHERLHRIAYPHQVLAGSTLAEQGSALGRWIVETFELLCGPPIPYR